MKKLFLILSLFVLTACKSQNTEIQIPPQFVGIWTNADGTDTVTITADTVTWTSRFVELHTWPSQVDFIYRTEQNFFSFSSKPVPFIVSLEKISRNKLKLFAQTQTEGGLLRCDDIYSKQTRTKN